MKRGQIETMCFDLAPIVWMRICFHRQQAMISAQSNNTAAGIKWMATRMAFRAG